VAAVIERLKIGLGETLQGRHRRCLPQLWDFSPAPACSHNPSELPSK
jgi:hypothetical protein